MGIETVPLHYKRSGSGPPLYILHGLLGSLDNWQTVANGLSENYTVFLVDLRNHGRSPHTTRMDYPSMAADLIHLAEQNANEAFFLCGHSMGGKVVMQAMADAPDKIRKAMVIDIAPRLYPGGHEKILEAMFAVPLDQIGKRADAEAILSNLIPDLATRQFILKNLDRTADNQFKWKCNLQGIRDSYKEICASVEPKFPLETPVCFLLGGNSNYLLPSEYSHVSSLFPVSEFRVIENAGHWVHAENPWEVMREMSAWFH
jgi:esterase